MSFLSALRSLLAVERVSSTFGDRTAEALRRDLESGRWESSARFLEQVRDWDEREFYVQALTDWPGRPAWLDVWIRDQPNSPIAWLIRGVHSKAWAWEARGSGYAETVGRQGLQLFDERLKQAEQELHRATELDPADPTAWAHLMWVYVGARAGLDKIRQAFDETVRRHPRHRGAHTALLQALCAKWYGSHQQMFEFARSVAGRLAEGSGLQVLVPIAHVERCWHFHRENDAAAAQSYFRLPEVIDEINEAARRSVLSPQYQPGRYAAEDRNYFAYCFHQMGQYVRARALFHQTAPWVTMPWGDNDWIAARRQCRPWWALLASLPIPYFGVNLVGIAILAAVFMSVTAIASASNAKPERVWNVAGGLSIMAIDIAYRRCILSSSLIDEDGGKLFHFPLWIWGILWIIVGAVQLVIHALS